MPWDADSINNILNTCIYNLCDGILIVLLKGVLFAPTWCFVTLVVGCRFGPRWRLPRSWEIIINMIFWRLRMIWTWWRTYFIFILNETVYRELLFFQDLLELSMADWTILKAPPTTIDRSSQNATLAPIFCTISWLRSCPLQDYQ